jgi:AcrR family transcriptional regulator
MIFDEARVAALYLDLGYDSTLRPRSESILAEMRSLVCVEVSDFSGFRAAVMAAANQQKPFEVKNRPLLDAILAAGDDEPAVLRLLNRDPVHSQIPFVEQIPVERSGAIVWVTPIEHPHVQKRASDTPRFEQLIQDLRQLYEDSHPARREHPRLNLLDALARLSRELKRSYCYLPAAMQLVEIRVAAFEAESIEPAALASGETLRRLLSGCEQIQTCCQRRWMRKGQAAELRRQAAELGALYLDHPGLHRRWLTSHILGTLLAPAHVDVRWRPSVSNSLALLRNELQTGSYDPLEIAARIRKLEAKGLYISSLAFPLLQLHIDGEDGSTWKSKKALAP